MPLPVCTRGNSARRKQHLRKLVLLQRWFCQIPIRGDPWEETSRRTVAVRVKGRSRVQIRDSPTRSRIEPNCQNKNGRHLNCPPPVVVLNLFRLCRCLRKRYRLFDGTERAGNWPRMVTRTSSVRTFTSASYASTRYAPGITLSRTSVSFLWNSKTI